MVKKDVILSHISPSAARIFNRLALRNDAPEPLGRFDDILRGTIDKGWDFSFSCYSYDRYIGVFAGLR